MIKQTFYILSFILLTILVSTYPIQKSIAQTTPAVTNSTILQGVMTNNLPINVAAQNIATNAGIPVNQATSILNNIKNNGSIKFPDAVKLLDDITNKQISGSVGQMLSKVSGLGNITNISTLSNLIQNATVVNDLNSLLKTLGPQVVQEQITKIIDLAGGNNALKNALTQAGSQAIANALNGVAPNLVNALGGTSALSTALGTTIGTVITITPPTATNPGTCSGCNGAQNKGPTTPGRTPSFPCTGSGCSGVITGNHNKIRQHVTNEFNKHRKWLEDVFWKQLILPAITRMNIQFSTVALQQVTTIGKFFDAKHQLETQRLLQQLSAEAYKDYTPSEGLCEFGTNTRSLTASTQKSNLTYLAIANRQLSREVRGNDTLSSKSSDSDKINRRAQFVSTYCDKSNNANGLSYLCKNGTPDLNRINKDINYTRSFDAPLTLNIDMSSSGSTTDEQEDIFALSANLYAHDVLPALPARRLADGNGDPREEAYLYMDFRSIAAKRSVAMNSFAEIAGLKSSGDKEVAPFLKRAVTELGVPDDEVEFVVGKNPSYNAQMEVLTKKLYQNPVFYTELYDKPANVRRKGVTLRAINLMQERDIYNSLLRSEAILAVTLETMLDDEQERVKVKLEELPIVENGTDTVVR